MGGIVGKLSALTSNVPAGDAVSPLLILILCVVAGIGTVMLLPGRREAAWRNIGGVVVLAAALILAASLIRWVASFDKDGMSLYFWIFAAVALFGSLRVVTHPRPVYSALYFVLTVLASAGLFVLMWADFMAAALVLIYAGAILVTYVFVIMLATQSSRGGGGGPTDPLSEYDAISREPLAASAIGFALMGLFLFVIFDKAPASLADQGEKGSQTSTTQRSLAVAASGPAMSAAAATSQPTGSGGAEPAYAPGSAQLLGNYLFRSQLVSVELAGLILTVGMVGAILIAKRKVVPPASLTGPDGLLAAVESEKVDDNPHSIPVYGTENPRAKQYPEA